MPENAEKFDGWAVVEVMGHKRLAGRCSEVNIAGAGMLRVDVPETQHERATFTGIAAARWTKPGYTKYVGGASIYCLTPCDEDVARAVAHELERYNDPLPVQLPKQIPATTGARAETVDADFDDEDDGSPAEFDSF